MNIFLLGRGKRMGSDSLNQSTMQEQSFESRVSNSSLIFDQMYLIYCNEIFYFLQLPVQAINKQVVNPAQYDQQPLADHQASPALTPRMVQNSGLIPVMVGFYK